MTVPLFKIKIDETVRSSFCVYTVSFVDCVNETFWVLPTLRVFPSECLSIIYLVFFFCFGDDSYAVTMVKDVEWMKL